MTPAIALAPQAAPLPLEHGIIIDHFAGGGGASEGIRLALGRCPDAAVNHDPEAVAMHTANHPDTLHYCEDVFAVSPQRALADIIARRPSARGQDVLLCWMSPDCTHFSKARGGKPVSERRRGLAWLAVEWAREVRPLVILIENVEEFFTWGPLGPDQRPDPRQMGVTFGLWKRQLEALGYEVAWRESRACDYGAPTTRKRLCVQARRDGRPIRWPKPTHGAPADIASANSGGELFADTRQPWRTAADIIDWSIPCPSIFDRERPLKDATCRRIASGIQRYVIDNPRPYLVRVSNAGGRDTATLDITDPLPTITTAKGGEVAVVAPQLMHLTHHGQRRAPQMDQPVPTVTAANRGELALLAPVMVQTDYTNTRATRAFDIQDPVRSITTQPATALVAAFMAQHNGGVIGHPMDKPASTITLRATQQNLVAAHLCVLRNNMGARDLNGPVPTITTGGGSAGGHMMAVAAHLTQFKSGCTGSDLDDPAPTLTARSHAGLVSAFMVKYYGAARDGQPLDQPLHTIPTADRFGLVTVNIDGVTYAITDIGMRMLTPRELASAQGFPADYQIAVPGPDGKGLSKTAQVARIGNSVCPPWAAAHIRAALYLE